MQHATWHMACSMQCGIYSIQHATWRGPRTPSTDLFSKLPRRTSHTGTHSSPVGRHVYRTGSCMRCTTGPWHQSQTRRARAPIVCPPRGGGWALTRVPHAWALQVRLCGPVDPARDTGDAADWRAFPRGADQRHHRLRGGGGAGRRGRCVCGREAVYAVLSGAVEPCHADRVRRSRCMWRGVAWRGVAWRGVERRGVERRGMVVRVCSSACCRRKCGVQGPGQATTAA